MIFLNIDKKDRHIINLCGGFLLPLTVKDIKSIVATQYQRFSNQLNRYAASRW